MTTHAVVKRKHDGKHTATARARSRRSQNRRLESRPLGSQDLPGHPSGDSAASLSQKCEGESPAAFPYYSTGLSGTQVGGMDCAKSIWGYGIPPRSLKARADKNASIPSRAGNHAESGCENVAEGMLSDNRSAPTLAETLGQTCATATLPEHAHQVSGFHGRLELAVETIFGRPFAGVAEYGRRPGHHTKSGGQDADRA